MIVIVGDIALGELPPSVIEGLPSNLMEGTWIGNLEGPIYGDAIQTNVVYSAPTGVDQLLEKYPFRLLSLANNHIQDAGVDAAIRTKHLLENRNIMTMGFGQLNTDQCLDRAILISSDVAVLNFGWSVIGCLPASINHPGCIDLIEDHILNRIIDAKAKYQSVIVYLHWGVELEIAPQPYHRNLARRMIDAGADLVVGAHAHRFQGAELYNGKVIVYGVGNWMFARKHFWNGQLDYPKTCDAQYFVTFDPQTKDIQLHQVDYIDNSQLRYIGPVALHQANQSHGLLPFETMNDRSYAKYFTQIRQKRKLLPIYYSTDGHNARKLKDAWIRWRHWGIMKIKELQKMIGI